VKLSAAQALNRPISSACGAADWRREIVPASLEILRAIIA
jgi:hypothetical protein